MAQVVKGTVKDEKGAPMEGVTVSLRGTKVATQTDFNGHFTISAPGDGTLELAMVGYSKKLVPIQHRTEILESMQITQSSMDDIVVIGYQRITRKKNTAAISSISGKELANLPAAPLRQPSMVRGLPMG